MRYLLFTLLFLKVVILNGQNTDNYPDKKISWGVTVSPDYSYRVLKGMDERGITDYRDDIEHPLLKYTTGLSIKYSLSQKLALESGVLFSAKGYKNRMIVGEWVTPADVISPGETVHDPLIPNEFIKKSSYYYLSVPFKLNVYLVGKQAKLFISGGILTDFYLDNRIQQILKFDDRTEKTHFSEKSDFNKISFAGIAGLGVDYYFNNNIYCRFEPVFRYSFTPVIDAPLKEHLYSFGANIVLFYNR